MTYIGVSPSNGVRRKHTYTATSGQTTFTGSGNAENVTLSYRDSTYVDVYRNGVKLGDADYTATSGTSIVLGDPAVLNDLIVIIVYDVFSVADTVSKAEGGTFDSNVTIAGTASATTFSGDLNGTINTATTATTQSAGNNTTKVATTAFVTTAVGNAEPFPAGTSMLFQQTSAPTGWTKQTTHNDKALRIVTGTVGTGGSSAFSTAFATPSVTGGAVSGNPGTNQTVGAGNLAVSISGNIANTTLAVSQIPSHSHQTRKAELGGNLKFYGNETTNGTNTSVNLNDVVPTGETGGGGSHNHNHNLSGSMTGSPTLSGNVTAGNLAVGASTAAINVNYVDFIIANKD